MAFGVRNPAGDSNVGAFDLARFRTAYRASGLATAVLRSAHCRVTLFAPDATGAILERRTACQHYGYIAVIAQWASSFPAALIVALVAH